MHCGCQLTHLSDPLIDLETTCFSNCNKSIDSSLWFSLSLSLSLSLISLSRHQSLDGHPHHTALRRVQVHLKLRTRPSHGASKSARRVELLLMQLRTRPSHRKIARSVELLLMHGLFYISSMRPSPALRRVQDFEDVPSQPKSDGVQD